MDARGNIMVILPPGFVATFMPSIPSLSTYHISDQQIEDGDGNNHASYKFVEPSARSLKLSTEGNFMAARACKAMLGTIGTRAQIDGTDLEHRKRFELFSVYVGTVNLSWAISELAMTCCVRC
jgi:hypothetical protein